MKKQLILVISPRMNSNRKKDRNEDRLIRMGSKTRANLGLTNDKTVELWPNTNSQERISRSKVLTIFQAFSSDLKNLKKSGVSTDEFNRSGFVTEKTFHYICSDGRRKKSDIWLADSIEDTVIGADPEFALYDKNKNLVHYAGHVPGFPFSGELSSDGPLAEIRPDPDENIEKFIKNIGKILKTSPSRKSIEKFDWLVDPYFRGRPADNPNQGIRDWTIGGHIHIGTPSLLRESELMTEATSYFQKASHYPGFLPFLNKALDEYIAIPLMKVAGKEPSVKRRKSGYGKYGSYRGENVGRLEYRTLSGIWLAHPEIAKAVIGATKAVSDAFFKILEEGEYKRNLLPLPKSSYSRVFHADYDGWKDSKAMKEIQAIKSSHRMKEILHEGQMTYNKQYYTKLRKMFRSLSTYKKYAKYIDRFLEIVSLPNENLKKINHNIKYGWVEGADFII